MTVGEIVELLDDLSAEEPQKDRGCEKRDKIREGLVERIDRKIMASS